MLDFHGKDVHFDEFADRYDACGVWMVLIGGTTPLPYKITTILSGATWMNFAAFMFFSIVASGCRFFLVAALLLKPALPIRDFIERRLGLVFTVFVAALIGGFAAPGFL